MLKLVNRAIQGVRTVAVNLRPASLELAVISAIRKLSDEFFKHTGVSCILQITENMIDPDEECAVATFRIVQESLTNVMKHAAASRVEITLMQSIDTFIMEVRDNGKEFNSADPGKKKSFGLIGMRERVVAMGGRIDIVSIQRQGTVVTARVPIKQNAEISAFTL